MAPSSQSICLHNCPHLSDLKFVPPPPRSPFDLTVGSDVTLSEEVEVKSPSSFRFVPLSPQTSSQVHPEGIELQSDPCIGPGNTERLAVARKDSGASSPVWKSASVSKPT
jgi:hypothetical protein